MGEAAATAASPFFLAQRRGAARLIPRARASRTSESARWTRAIGDQPGHPCHESREGNDPPRPATPASASAGVHARGRQGEEDATLRGSPAGVRSGDPSEARPSRPRVPVALPGTRCIPQSNGCPTGVTGMDGSENPHHVGDGGSRSRAADRYSSAASLHGAECLALTAWT